MTNTRRLWQWMGALGIMLAAASPLPAQPTKQKLEVQRQIRDLERDITTLDAQIKNLTTEYDAAKKKVEEAQALWDAAKGELAAAKQVADETRQQVEKARMDQSVAARRISGDFELTPDFQIAKSQLLAAQRQRDAAYNKVMDPLKATPDYMHATASLEDAARRVEQFKVQPPRVPQEMIEASMTLNERRSALTRMEQAALQASPEFVEAEARLKEAQARMDELNAKLQALLEQDAEYVAATKIVNDGPSQQRVAGDKVSEITRRVGTADGNVQRARAGVVRLEMKGKEIENQRAMKQNQKEVLERRLRNMM